MIVEDHPVYRQGLQSVIEKIAGVQVCSEADNAGLALSRMRESHPDVVFLDISLPGSDGIEVMKSMLVERPDLIILVISMHDEAVYALRALRAGARGYVMKQHALEAVPEALQKAIEGKIYVSAAFMERIMHRAIHASGTDACVPIDILSDRELEVFLRFGRGETTREVADHLHLSAKTIETHRAHLKEKLGFADTEQLLKFAAEWAAATGNPSTQ